MTDTSPPPDQHIENAFFSLLAASIENAYFAATIAEPGSKSRFTRLSILSAAITIESAANSCFQRISFPPKVSERIERSLGTLDKFDMFSVALFHESKFDRGCKATQQIKDLIDLRNDYVHPKIIALPVVARDDAKKQVSINSGMREFLKIERSPRAWTDITPQTVLSAVDSFLTYFFLDHAKWQPAQATDFLIPQLILDGKIQPPSPDFAAEIELVGKARTLWGIDFRFVDSDRALGKPHNT